ncbi:hypothetical protein NUH88_16810 [Nisaea acidiphila]|uniref:Uncharacterized protein n=1 Tax=Nisaea acidiphila TaxID=1862145 RepID=A0A9J7AUI0_9PROT|nr:hypothetical protein [Nisaea acidiphila]UUX49053.1 hypothetical protein NUH88_16810 [Nisaea acidiphila]
MASSSANAASMKVILITIVGGLMLFTLPTVLVLGIGMMPTFAAMAIDRRREKYTTLCVGCMNFVGVLPFVAQLWSEGHSYERAFAIMADPFAWLTMLGAAGLGWCIYLIAPGIVSMGIAMRIEQRIGRLRKRQRELVEEWGPGVAGALDETAHAAEAEPAANPKEG